ncbi:MAG TPA: N-acetylmuramoyl-L-alanine amidase [Syntrophomonadaceae bacterium]|nr:N-acetylmuramoyl-L-alanine amidase [Syntrophomonadaceae bacterium]
MKKRYIYQVIILALLLFITDLLLGYHSVWSSTNAIRTFKVKAPTLNLRSGPGTNFNKVGEVYQGDHLILVEAAGPWYKIRSNGGIEAYVLASLIEEEVAAGESTVNTTGVQVLLNQKALSFDVPPVIDNGRTLVSMRAICASLGAAVVWDERSQTVRATLEGKVVELEIGSFHFTVDGQDRALDVPARIENGRTLVPLRFVSEAFGGQVAWDGSKGIINISTAQPVISGLNVLLVEEDSINLRSGPATTYDIVGTALRGEKMEPLVQLGDWYKVKYWGKEVWVAGWLVTPLWQKANTNQAIPAVSQLTTQGTQEKEVSLDYRYDSDGIRLTMLCGSQPDLKISEKDNLTIYRYPGFFVKENKTWEETTSAGRITIKASNQDNAVVVEISLPSGFEKKRNEEAGGKKQVFFIPNSVLGVERASFGVSGERLLINTLLPITYTNNLSGNIMSVKLPNVSKGLAQSKYKYDSPSLAVLDFEQSGSDMTIKVNTHEEAKFSIGLSNGGKSLHILLISKSDLPVPQNLVVLDPGHGGTEYGSSGQYLAEKDVNLSISLKVGAILERKGIQVSYTRTDDSYHTLEERPALANLLNAALFVSIHNNSFGDCAANGSETFFYAPLENPQLYLLKKEREQIATLIQQKLIAALGLRDRGVKDKNYSVLRNSQAPCALTEIAFLSNPNEEGLLQQEDFQNKAAVAIAEAISQYMQDAK